jgi:hypothetical protein
MRLCGTAATATGAWARAISHVTCMHVIWGSGFIVGINRHYGSVGWDRTPRSPEIVHGASLSPRPDVAAATCEDHDVFIFSVVLRGLAVRLPTLHLGALPRGARGGLGGETSVTSVMVPCQTFRADIVVFVTS